MGHAFLGGKRIFAPSAPVTKEFESRISLLSPEFVSIYKQAEIAEYAQLDLVCGVGYRKSLEFLLKDYAKSKHPDDSAQIGEMLIVPLINRFVASPELSSVAQRAAWLGNDETHYVRRWADKELSDLKKLIDATVHWISMDIMTREFESSMPPRTKK